MGIKKLNSKLFFLLMAVVTVQLTFSQELPQLPDNVPELPDVDEDQLRKPAEEGKRTLQEKCLKVSGGEQAFNELEASKDKLIECAQNIVNVTVFQVQLDEAEERRAIEEVVETYCKRKPDLLNCVNSFKGPLENCLEDKEKAVISVVMNITVFLLDLTCFKDDDRIGISFVFGEELPQLPDNVPELPEMDEDQLRKSAEEGKRALQEKCLKVSGGEEAFNELEASKDKLIECAQNIVNVTVFQAELDEAKKRGAMEEVFGKYCKRKPDLLNCVNSFKDTLENCMEDKEKATFKIIMNITESLLEFMCFKDGDRIAMFIAEGGFECIESKKTEVQSCVNSTYSELIPKDMNIANLGELMIIDSEKCDNFTKLQKCVTEKLEGCENQTPANVVESLFKYVKKSLPCTTTTAPKETGEVRKFKSSGGDIQVSTGFIILLTSLFSVLHIY